MTDPLFAKLARGLDSAISALAPGLAVRRAAARAQLDAMAYFTSTIAPLRSDRASGPVTSGQATVDERVPYWDRLKMINLFDTMIHENSLLAGLVDQFICNVIPHSGIRPIPQTGDAGLDGELTARFEDWAESAELRGLSFWNYQRPWLKTMLGHGDNLTVQVRGRLQGVSANRIQTPGKHTRHEGVRVHQGVYTGVGPTPMGYYVGSRSGTGTLAQMTFRYVPAAYAFHAYDPGTFDLDCHRGVSRFLPAFPHLRRVESLIRYKTFQEKMASVFGIAIKKSKDKPRSPLQAIGDSTRSAEAIGEERTTSTRADIELFSGMGITLADDEDISTIEHNAHGGDFESFVRLVCRIIALSAGLPLEFCLLDWTKANYYGNRMSASSGRRRFLEVFAILRAFVSWAYRWKAQEFIDTGAVRVPASIERDPLSHETTLPPPIVVDELKEFQAHRQRVEAGVDTWENWCRSQNRVFLAITEQRAREIETQRANGVPIIAASTPGVTLLSKLEAESAPKKEPKPQ